MPRELGYVYGSQAIVSKDEQDEDAYTACEELDWNKILVELGILRTYKIVEQRAGSGKVLLLLDAKTGEGIALWEDQAAILAQHLNNSLTKQGD